MKLSHRVVVTGVGLTLATGALVGCSSSSGSSSTATSASASAAAGSGATTGGGNNLFSDTKVQQCLTAAGISIPTGGARPSGAGGSGGTPPSGAFPSGGAGGGTPPSGARPSGAAGGFGGGANSADMAKIQAALKACGITLPTGNGAAAAPSSSSTS